MIRSVVHLAKREVSALQKNTNKMQIRSNMMCCHLILYIITRSNITPGCCFLFYLFLFHFVFLIVSIFLLQTVMSLFEHMCYTG